MAAWKNDGSVHLLSTHDVCLSVWRGVEEEEEKMQDSRVEKGETLCSFNHLFTYRNVFSFGDRGGREDLFILASYKQVF